MKTWQIYFSPPKGHLTYSGVYVVANDYERAILEGYKVVKAMFGRSYDKNHLDAVRNYNAANTPQEGWSRWTAIFAFDPVTQEHEIAQVETNVNGKEARAMYNLWSTRLPHQLVYVAQLTHSEALKKGYKS